MPKIIISTTNDISTDNRVNKIALLLLELGYEVLWVGRVLPNSLPLQREYKTHRMKLFFTKGALFYAEFNIRLFFFLLFNKSDVLLSNDLDTLLANYLVSRLKRKDLVYDTHEYFLGVPENQDNALAKTVWTKIERWIFPQLKTVFTVNNSIASLYEQDYGFRPKVFRNISPVTIPEKVKRRTELGLPENKMIVINQGSGINVDRGMEEALEAILQIENAVLLLVGSGDVVPQLRAEVKNRNIEDKVIFVDRVPYAELLQYTANADVGISLDKDTNINYKYSLPNKLFDYIHCGIPVVCSRVVEVKSIVDKYAIGKSVNSHKPEEIASAISEVLSHGKTYYQEKLKKASQAENWEQEKEVPAEVYKQLLLSK
ncbi:MAG: glycosyltransferase [Schleiferiaceae bacterium]|jgi:glycosyltransferase involved in cell wall biosynthesis|nr:glycosyltransferase [Schleiferiaceae bacterium]